MKIPFYILLLFLLLPNTVRGQQKLNAVVVDRSTLAPIADVNVFIANGNSASSTNHEGKVSLKIRSNSTEEMIVSHISYDAIVLDPSQYKNMSKGDTIYMDANGFALDQVVISGRRSKKWKKYFKRFATAFLGQGEAAQKCEILNPEVLSFSERKGTLTVEAKDLIKVRNEHLGYEIEFLLTAMEIDKKGGSLYKGYPTYTDIDSTNINYLRAREEAHRHSLKCFLRNLASSDYPFDDSYALDEVSYDGKDFKPLKTGTDTFLRYDSLSNLYLLDWKEFLHITHLEIEETTVSTFGTISGLEATRFTNSQSSQVVNIDHPESYLYKAEPYLIFDQYGNILNTKAIKEYGYWANYKMALGLPTEYSLEEDVVNDEIMDIDELQLMKELLYGSSAIKQSTLVFLRTHWKSSYVPPLLEIIRMSNDQELVKGVNRLLDEKTELKAPIQYYDAVKWMWESNIPTPDYLLDFKAEIYQYIDASFRRYFLDRQSTSKINTAEILWGGVKRDGIPPLRLPKSISADRADYLGKEDIVFGLVINGQAKAYPKRILGWHEMFLDQVGGESVAGVYCTLCGTMIAYNMRHGDKLHSLGTSGFLYRSNKLMYDRQTYSLWNTIEGRPVLGPLVDQGIQLATFTVQTTTWEEWKSMYPDSEVLSLETGYDRNYAEGEAYKDYYSNDRLMFPVPYKNGKLRNKDEVIVVRLPELKEDPVAFSREHLRNKSILNHQIAGRNILLISSPNGAVKVFDRKHYNFHSLNPLLTQDGTRWRMTDDALISESGTTLDLLPSHSIFWFAWINTYPNSRLVH